MKRKTIKFMTAFLCIMLALSAVAFEASAANVTTVKAIPQNTTSAINYLKSNVGDIKGQYLVPGLMQSVTRTSDGKTVTTCSNMTPQGFCFADSGNYILISSYCNCGKHHRSVIYVIDASSKTYKTTLILDNNCHVGGIACLGGYIWVCDSTGGSYLRAYKMSSIKDAIGHNYWTVYTQAKRSVAVTPSFICAANSMLYIGTCLDSTSATICFYSLSGTSLSKKGSFKISGPNKLQGISIRDGYMIVTSSFGRKNISKAYVYKDKSGLFKKSGKTYSSAYKTFKLANMAEGVYIGSSYTYFLFESGAKIYRETSGTRPLDKYVRFSNSTLGIK